MSEYKIVFSDIDGTLLTSNHEVSKKTKNMINELKKIEVPFVLVSARMPKGILKIQKEIDYKSPIVCYSGGLVVDMCGNYIFSNGIDINTVCEMIDYIKLNWNGVSTSCYCYDEWIVDNKNDQWIKQESEITSVKPIEGDILNLCKDSIIHKVLCMGNPETIDDIQKELIKKFKGLSIYKSKDTYLEIMDKNANKSCSMKILCDLLNIKIQESIAMGDNYNDVDMIKTAGLGVAMGNAPKEVKEASDIVTESNDEDGVALIIKKYFFD